MERIIITLKDITCQSAFDLEVPLNLEVDKLIDDIIQTLNSSDSRHRGIYDSTRMFSPRLNRYLDRTETFETAGIWNGDYIELISDLTTR